MEDFINLLQEKGYSQYIGCSDCGCYYKPESKMYVRSVQENFVMRLMSSCRRKKRSNDLLSN